MPKCATLYKHETTIFWCFWVGVRIKFSIYMAFFRAWCNVYMSDEYTWWYKGTEFPTIEGLICWSGLTELSFFSFEIFFLNRMQYTVISKLCLIFPSALLFPHQFFFPCGEDTSLLDRFRLDIYKFYLYIFHTCTWPGPAWILLKYGSGSYVLCWCMWLFSFWIFLRPVLWLNVFVLGT
jgi:hypothetical protein